MFAVNIIIKGNDAKFIAYIPSETFPSLINTIAALIFKVNL